MCLLENSELHVWISFHVYWTKSFYAITSIDLNLYWDHDLPSSFYPILLGTGVGAGWVEK